MSAVHIFFVVVVVFVHSETSVSLSEVTAEKLIRVGNWRL